MRVVLLALVLLAATTAAADPGTFRIVTWQIGPDAGTNATADAEKVGAALAKLNPDVVLLQGASKGGGGADAGVIAKFLKLQHCYAAVADLGNGQSRGLAILARRAPREVTELELPRGEGPALGLLAVVKVPGPDGDTDLAVISVELNGSSSHRFVQAVKLVEHLREIEHPFALGGDLGGESADQAHKLLNERNSFLTKSEPKGTWPAEKPQDERDHLLVRSDAFTLKSCNVVAESDIAAHRPVVAVLALKGE